MFQTTNDDIDTSQQTKKSNHSTDAVYDNETLINSITGFEKDLTDRLELLERDAEIHARQIELGECLEYVAQLVDLFKHTVITMELKNQNHWHHNTQDNLQKHKGITGNRLLDDKVEKIVLSRGLNKEQWNCLLYISYNNGDTMEITKSTKQHLHKVRDMASRLLEDTEQSAVFALIKAMETYMAKNHFIQK